MVVAFSTPVLEDVARRIATFSEFDLLELDWILHSRVFLKALAAPTESASFSTHPPPCPVPLASCWVARTPARERGRQQGERPVCLASKLEIGLGCREWNPIPDDEKTRL